MGYWGVWWTSYSVGCSEKLHGDFSSGVTELIINKTLVNWIDYDDYNDIDDITSGQLMIVMIKPITIMKIDNDGLVSHFWCVYLTQQNISRYKNHCLK